jgi:hypothetical protein
MKQTQRDRVWKVLESMFLGACVLFLVVNARGVIRWLIGFTLDAAVYSIGAVALGLLAATLGHLFRYREWVRRKYPNGELTLVKHLDLYRHWRRISPLDLEEEQADVKPKLSK